jgi:hypothetical protein
MSYRIGGIDVHKRVPAVVVSNVEIEGEYPNKLRTLAAWLLEQEGEEVVMESTGQRSPRHKPMVSFCSLKISLLQVCTVIIFFIAGLLYLVLRARRSLGA